MKVIILAAGKGTRMGSLTDKKPKCMITYKGKSLINYTIQTIRACGINEIIIIDGYNNNILKNHLLDDKIKFITNKKYSTTNMVYTLFCAESEMNDDLIISYADIIYNKEVLKNLINNNNNFVVTVDKKWLDLWKIRMDNPLLDAETMKIDKDCNIVEIGNKPKSYLDIHGQYVGLIKISNSVLKMIRRFYHKLDKTKKYDGKNFNNMYMTSFIQLIVDSGCKVKADLINGGWLEFDNQNDLNVYEDQKNLL